jgi:hypothetical protein
MGYQSPQFEDAYDWCRIMDTNGPHCDWGDVVHPGSSSIGPHLASLPLPQLSARSLLASSGSAFGGFHLQASPFVLVTGVVQTDPVKATLGQVLTLPDQPKNLPGYPAASTVETGFEVVVVDGTGQVLATAPIVQTTINHDSLGVIAFLTGLPLPADAQTLEIRLGDQVLAERPFSQHAPQVQLESPNGGEVFTGPFEIHWKASDEDGDPLSYTLQYSPDDGQTWQALAVGLTEPSYQVLSLYSLTGSDQGLVRVLASDGTQTSSDVSDGTFSIPNSPPMPVVQSPGHLAVFPLNGRVPLWGSATDREDGELPPSSLTWESSIDGFLGTGDRLEVDDLSPGNHVITLTVEDSQGATGQAHVGIIIDPNRVRQVPSDDELSLASQILAEGPGAGAAVATAPKSYLPLILVLAGALLLSGFGLVLFLPLVRGRRRR